MATANYVPILTKQEVENTEPHRSTPFGQLLFRSPLMLLYWAPTAAHWNRYFTIDDYGDAVETDSHSVLQYMRQGGTV